MEFADYFPIWEALTPGQRELVSGRLAGGTGLHSLQGGAGGHHLPAV